MALSGPQALKSLDDAVRDIRDEEGRISKRLARNGERIAKLRETESGLFRQLAGIRLANSVGSHLSGQLSEAEKKAHILLEQYGANLSAAEDALGALDEKVADQARARRALLEDIDRSQAELKALSGKISQAIAKDPAYEEKRNRAEELSQVAAESLRKTEIAETDREQKGRPYRGDPLFMYLWESGYGTTKYKAGNLVRWLDSMVARLIGFYDARPNYAMLNEIPLRLREHAERQAKLAQDAEDELDALEQDAIDAAGGKPVREALVIAQTNLEKIDAEMAALEDERDEQAQNYRQLADGQSPAFEEANRILTQSLEQQDIHSLLASARDTATGEDDVIVTKIDDTRERVADEAQEASEHKERLHVLATRRRELEDIEWEFKKARFDDPRSVFREDDLAGDMLGEFLRGAVTAAVYWQQWRSSQNWQPGTTDWGGGIGLPRSGRQSKRRQKSSDFQRQPGRSSSKRSGGFSRPRSGSRGSRKSGGFKTGGGF